LILVKERRIAKTNTDDYTSKVDAEKLKLIKRKTTALEAQLAETVGELDKSRHLLITQVKINADYKKEVLLIQSKMEENKAEFDSKMLEYAQLLDLRAARIKKLERQLKDIAYGTKQVRIPPVPSNTESTPSGKRRDSFSFVGAPQDHMLDSQLIANLERGQNIFEIHLTRITLSAEAVRLMAGETDPSTFCTIEFFEHELQTTPKVNGQKPEYNFTSQYVIRVDDFFLHYLQKETTTVELHQAIGSDYETRAVCHLSFRDLIDKQVPRIHGSANLLSVDGSNVSFATLEYWCRLIMPFDEAFRLYKERTKTLGSLSSNNRAAKEHELRAENKKARSADNMNQLNVNVLRCARVNTAANQSQPSPYCVYKFYDFKDHDTEVIPASNYPEFNDHKSFAVQMDIDLDKYLKNQALEVYVFDDSESDQGEQGLYLGVAKVPLIGLTHDKDIKGSFELKRADGSVNGTLDITLYWQFSYLPPSGSTFAVSGSKHPEKQESGPVLIQGEKLLKGQPMSVHEKAKKMGVKLPKKVDEPVVVPSRSPSVADEPHKRVSICSESEIGNATLRRCPDPENPSALPATRADSENENNQHYNDTLFEDEQQLATNDFDSIRDNYQQNLASVSDEERELRSNGADNEEIEEDIDEEMDEKETMGTNRFDTEESAIVVGERGSWDPNGTNKLPKEGDEDHVIIEISSFMFKDGCEVVESEEVKKLFVGMNFLNYDPADLESKSSLPKPAANEPVYFHFRKSKISLVIIDID